MASHSNRNRSHSVRSSVTRLTTGRRAGGFVACITMVSALAACEVVESDTTPRQQDTGATGRIVAESARGNVVADSSLVTSTLPGDSARLAGDSVSTTAADDTGVVRLYPTSPRRGGVVFALAEGVTTPAPRCTWKSAPIPCYRADSGVVVTVPLPADEEAGTFTLTIDRPGGRITRQVAVEDHEFGRELIFLTDSLYQRAANTREIARDARAMRGIASVQSTDRRWSGRWRIPVMGGRSTGYGVERYYYRATDSTRSIALDSQARTRGMFAADTSDAPLSGAPSWRHAGIDMPARRGASVSAPAAGMVADVGEYILSGRTVLIDHGQGAVSAYFHLDTAVVEKGDMVRAGQRIGRVGATGLATGPHLHYGLYLHGKDVDPSAWRAMPDWMLRTSAHADSAANADTSRGQRK